MTPVRFHFTRDELIAAIGEQFKTKSNGELSKTIRADVSFSGNLATISFNTQGHYKVALPVNSSRFHFKIHATDFTRVLARRDYRVLVEPTWPGLRRMCCQIPDEMLAAKQSAVGTPVVPPRLPTPRTSTTPQTETPRKYVSVVHPHNFEEELETALGIINDVLKTKPKDTDLKFTYGGKTGVLKAQVTKPKIIGG